RVGPARKDDAFGLPLADPGDRPRRRMDFAVDVRLANPTRDQLGVLGSEIDDQNAFVMLGHAESALSGVARSPVNRSPMVSRRREIHQRSPSTMASAARGREL